MRACARCGTFVEQATPYCGRCRELVEADVEFAQLRRLAVTSAVVALAILAIARVFPPALWLGLASFGVSLRGVLYVGKRAMAREHWQWLRLPHAVGIVVGAGEVVVAAVLALAD